MSAAAVLLPFLVAASDAAPAPAWKSLPLVSPAGEKAHTGSYVVKDRAALAWERPPFVPDARVSIGRKAARVAVVVYDPILEREGGQRMTEFLRANDPVEYSRILVNVIREASWGYVNYDIVDVIRVDGFPVKTDGFRYGDESFLEVRQTQEWQSATISYAKMLEETGLLERCRKEAITEVWLWGCGGMHFDEFAMFVPNRYARFGPTDNPWLYRPYDLPESLGRTTFVMGFNYEVGADNMIHSFTHRVESMCALALADGVWSPKTADDPWNVFTRLEMEFPGTPSHVGNCHVPPNGEKGYDYGNERRVLSFADNWARYPDVRGEARLVSRDEWGGNQFGYQKWILERVPKFPGHTRHGYNNWWVYVANTDEDLPDLSPPDPTRFLAPE